MESVGGPEPGVALVTGASGRLGRLLVRSLVAQHWSVRALVRHEPASIDNVWLGDITDSSAIARAAEGADVVFHLAARRDLTQVGAREMERVNVEGTQAVAHASRTAGVSRVVYFSSTSVYGDTRGRVADERSRPRPTSHYARTKLAAESVILNEAPGGVVLRVAAVYGPSDHGNYRRLAALCRRGIRVAGGVRRTLVYETDLVTAAQIAAKHPAASGGVFNVTDGAVHTLTAILESMAAVLRVRTTLSVPVAPLIFLSRVTGGRPRQLQGLFEDSAVDGLLMQRNLGYTPTTSLHAGWKLTIDAWRERGLI